MERNGRIGTGGHARADLAVRLSEWLARHGMSSAVTAGSYGKNEPPCAGPGERSKSTGLAAKGRSLARDYRPGFGWQSLALGAILSAVLVAVLVPTDVMNRIIHGPPRVSVARPDVLVVSGSASDHAAVMQTAQPRGYTVRAAANVEVGLENLRRGPDRIGFVMIDGNLAGAKRMVSAAKTACPDARVMLLDGNRGTGRISQLLLDAGMD